MNDIDQSPHATFIVPVAATTEEVPESEESDIQPSASEIKGTRTNEFQTGSSINHDPNERVLTVRTCQTDRVKRLHLAASDLTSELTQHPVSSR